MPSPRIRDLDLADKLGYERPHDIRELIRRFDSLLGVIRTVRKTSGERGGRPGVEFWLTEEQATLGAETVPRVVPATRSPVLSPSRMGKGD